MIQAAVADVICGKVCVGTAGIVTPCVTMPPIVSVEVLTVPAAVASSLIVPLPVMSPFEESASPWIVAGLSIVIIPFAHTLPFTVAPLEISTDPFGT